MLLWMFWHTLTACRPPRSGSRQLTLITSQYVQSVLPAVINDHMTRPLQLDAVYLSHCLLAKCHIAKYHIAKYHIAKCCLNICCILCLCVQLDARESAVEKMWDVGIVEPANSLIGYSLFFGQNEESHGVEAFWQAQGNTTETHSDIVSDLFWRLLSSCMLKSIIYNNVNRCAHAQEAHTAAQHALLDNATTEAEVRSAMTAT